MTRTCPYLVMFQSRGQYKPLFSHVPNHVTITCPYLVMFQSRGQYKPSFSYVPNYVTITCPYLVMLSRAKFSCNTWHPREIMTLWSVKKGRESTMEFSWGMNIYLIGNQVLTVRKSRLITDRSKIFNIKRECIKGRTLHIWQVVTCCHVQERLKHVTCEPCDLL